VDLTAGRGEAKFRQRERGEVAALPSVKGKRTSSVPQGEMSGRKGREEREEGQAGANGSLQRPSRRTERECDVAHGRRTWGQVREIVEKRSDQGQAEGRTSMRSFLQESKLITLPLGRGGTQKKGGEWSKGIDSCNNQLRRTYSARRDENSVTPVDPSRREKKYH